MNSADATVHSVEKALTILEALSGVHEMGISELSRELGIGKATIYRLITTLRIHGYVEQTVTEKYKLSFKLFELGNMMVNQIGIRKTSHPFLEQLAVATKETVNLAVLDQSSVIYIDRIESPEPLRMILDVGTRFPVFCSALGLTLLAYLEPAEVDNLLAQVQQEGQLIKYTENTIVDLNFIKEKLSIIRKQSYTFDNEFYLAGIRSIAAPVFNHSGRVIAAISVTGPSIRMTDKVVSEFIPLVKESAKSTSIQLGFLR